MNNIKKVLISVFLISLATRIFYLAVTIPSLSNDEADLYLSSYMLAKSGSDYYDNKLFLTSGILTAKPSIPIYIGALSWLFNQEKNVLSARLLFALINSFTPLIFFLTIYLLTKNKMYSWIAFLTLNFSPWFSYISVTGYESLISFFFINISLLLSVSNIKRTPKTILLFTTFFLIFSSYMAIRTYIPLLIMIVLLLGGYFNYKSPIKSIFQFLVIAILSTSLFAFANYYLPNSELVKREFNFLVTDERSDMEGRIWYERLTTNAPEKIKTILSNKVTVRLNDYAQKYLTVFDTKIFFIKGDPSSLYGTAGLIGLFYFTDFIFLIYGLMHLTSLNRKLKYILLFILLGSIPIALTRTEITYILRGIILLIPLTIVIAHGVNSLLKKTHKKLIHFVALTFVNIAIFNIIYITRVTPLNAKAWQINKKNLALKLNTLNKDKKIIVFDSEARQNFIHYAFYNMKDPLEIKQKLRADSFSHANVEYMNTCPKDISGKNIIYIMYREYCGQFYKKYEGMSLIELKQQSIKINRMFLKNIDMSGDDFVLIEKY